MLDLLYKIWYIEKIESLPEYVNSIGEGAPLVIDFTEKIVAKYKFVYEDSVSVYRLQILNDIIKLNENYSMRVKALSSDKLVVEDKYSIITLSPLPLIIQNVSKDSIVEFLTQNKLSFFGDFVKFSKTLFNPLNSDSNYYKYVVSSIDQSETHGGWKIINYENSVFLLIYNKYTTVTQAYLVMDFQELSCLTLFSLENKQKTLLKIIK